MVTIDNLKYDILLSLPGIEAFSTRRGDNVIVADSYSGFNACDYTGDAPDHIESCRDALCAMLCIDRDNLIIPRQTHSLNVAVIEHIPVNPTSIYDVDALVTTLPRVALAVNTADCVPLLLADIQAGVIAAVHSGWKGTVGRIVAKTVNQMVALGADCSNIVVAMGPCICGDCFEVGTEVVAQFRDARLDYPGVILPRTPRNHIDLPQACRATLLECGVKPQNIALPQACSRCNHDRYFSARRLGINSGRTLSVIIKK